MIVHSILLLHLPIFVICVENHIFVIPNGNIKGFIQTSADGQSFYGFTSIPYAKPPIGDLRFRKPQKAFIWNGTLDATKETPICLQPKEKKLIGYEDCLYLNVYTNNMKPDILGNVMVYFHGGFWMFGNANLNPEYLMKENLVIVQIHYRLNAYGFLNGFSEQAGSLNNAFRDQILALKWVRDNIQYFGGNPKSVTLIGESAGAMSIHVLMLSPLAEGLFHRAICMSESLTLNMFSYNTTARMLAEALDLQIDNGTDNNQLVDKLRFVSPEDIFKAQIKLNWFTYKLNVPNFESVTIEKPSKYAVIDGNPRTLVRQGKYNKVPIMISFTNMEGLLFLTKGEQIKNLSAHVPWFFENHTKVLQNLTEFYHLNDEDPNLAEIAMYGDIWFKYNTYRTALEYSLSGLDDIYFCIFSADTSLNFLKQRNSNLMKNYPGACHADDIGYLFNTSLNYIPLNTNEQMILSSMIKIRSEFAKNGKPGDKNWLPFSYKNPYYVNITKDGVIYGKLDEKNFEFWNEMYKTFTNGMH